MTALLAIEGLTVCTQRNAIRRVLLDRVSLTIPAGRIVGLAGESGSGKSMLALSIAGLLPNGCAVTSGRVIWRGEDLTAAGAERVFKIRGAEVAYVFQEPMTALNPTLRIGRQLVDVIRRHRGVDPSDARQRALALLADVQITDPAVVFDRWPHQLSGGMRQRVLIAMAFSCEPSLIVADEPTTALDVMIRSQVLDLLTGLARKKNTAVLMITHDVGVIQRVCDEVQILYAGRTVESGPRDAVLQAPRHPYTRALMACLPEHATPKSRLRALPSSDVVLPGCVFRARCDQAFARCVDVPVLDADSSVGHRAACWAAESGSAHERTDA